MKCRYGTDTLKDEKLSSVSVKIHFAWKKEITEEGVEDINERWQN
jgi:hypothetical protein